MVSFVLNAFTSLTVWFRPSVNSVSSDFFDISSIRSHGCKLFDNEGFGQSFLKHFCVAASCSTSQSRRGTPDSSELHRQGGTAPVKKCHSEHCAPSFVPYMTLSGAACPISILIVFAWHLDHDDATCFTVRMRSTDITEPQNFHTSQHTPVLCHASSDHESEALW